MNTKKIAYGGVLLALGVLLPQALHLTGIPGAGMVFLPMHIPVLLAGFLLGPLFGLLVGILAPIVSAFITGMPPMDRLPFMVIELALYGGISGLFFWTLGFRHKKGGIYLTLIVSMLIGRAGYALLLVFAAKLLQIPGVEPIAALWATTTGGPGIVIQIILVPSIVYQIEKRK